MIRTTDHSPARRHIPDAARHDPPSEAYTDTAAYVERLSYRMFVMLVSLNALVVLVAYYPDQPHRQPLPRPRQE